MKRTILFEDPNLRIEHVAHGNYLHQTWWGFTSSDTFLRLLEFEIIKFLHETKGDGILIDACEHAGLGPETQKRAAELISEYAKTHGNFKEAIIIPEVVFSKFSVESYGQMFDPSTPIETRYFDDLEAAHAWLNELP